MDTVRLKFKRSLPGTIFFKDKIHSKELNLATNSGSRFIYTNITWRKDRIKRGFYTPKYWIEEDYLHKKTYFVIELSIPKLLFGENLSELSSDDFEKVQIKIIEFLKEINIFVSKQELSNTVPIVLAIGKNINFTNLCSCDQALNLLSHFNYRFRSTQSVISFGNGGREIYFGYNKNTTFKLYSKLPEIAENAITKKEKDITNEWLKKRYKAEKINILEIIRVELTFRRKQSIIQNLSPYLGNKKLSFKNIFDDSLWFTLLKKEIDNIYNHPLKNFICLSIEEAPFIQAFLDKEYKCIKTKYFALGILTSLQEKGLEQTKNDVLHSYVRQTWHNQIKRLKKLEKQINFSSLNNNSLINIVNFLLTEFEIETKIQIKLL